MDGLSVGYEDMTVAELRAAAAGMLAEVERREAEEAARAAVEEAVRAYADAQGITVLEAWRALAPEQVEVPVPEPVDAPDWVQPSGAHDAYGVGDLARFKGVVYESIIPGNTWSPAAYPQGWKVVQ